jgi:membrane associated rhomboid family serine protease
MSGRRIRAPLPPRPRIRVRQSTGGALHHPEEEEEADDSFQGIFVPPPMEKGLRGRDDVDEYRPYSPNVAFDSKVRYWPPPPKVQPLSVAHQDSLDSNRPRQAAQQKQQAHWEERKDATVRRPRGNRYALSPEENGRYQPEYRQMEEHLSASYVSEGSFVRANATGTSQASREEEEEASVVVANHRLGFLSKSASLGQTFETADSTIKEVNSDGGDSFFRVNGPVAVCTITITALQLLLLMLQLAMCGVAPLDVNPMIGPFPDAFSQWGGKNPYLLLHDNEWWRLFSPAFLHVGILHLAVNMYSQWNAASMFEREWGGLSWLFIYVCSEIGCSTFSNLLDPDTVAVGSTGALMGLFAAKLAQVVTFSFFDTKSQYGDAIRIDQLTPILLGLTLSSLLGALTYIDFSGNLGGLVAGFFAGISVFSGCIRGCCWSFFWRLLGLLGLGATYVLPVYFLLETVEPDEQLADVCEYFRRFFPEGYECGCLWNS